MSVTGTYGTHPATATLSFASSGRVNLYVSLHEDPGFGSMSYAFICPTQFVIQGGDVADLRACADDMEHVSQYLIQNQRILAEVKRVRELADRIEADLIAAQ